MSNWEKRMDSEFRHFNNLMTKGEVSTAMKLLSVDLKRGILSLKDKIASKVVPLIFNEKQPEASELHENYLVLEKCPFYHLQ